jgi:hypothetical protein
MCIHAMKLNNINKIYYSTDNGDIECIKVNDIKIEHISDGIVGSIKLMSKQNQYLIFGFTLHKSIVDKKTKYNYLKKVIV